MRGYCNLHYNKMLHAILPHIALFLRHGADFVGYLFGGEFDVVYDGLWGLMVADVHHLEDGVSMAEIHIGDAGASGGVACLAVIAEHDHIAVEVGLWLHLFLSKCFFLLHRELGWHFFFAATSTAPTGL